jgi:hypothetical protein
MYARAPTSRKPNGPELAATWLVSDEAHQFVALSSELWCQASIAAGTPATEALAAAERTVAAYTGAEPPPQS